MNVNRNINDSLQQGNTIKLSSLVIVLYITLNVIISPLARASTDCNQVTNITQDECNTLVALYNNTNGSEWIINTDWNITNSPCGWYGVICSSGHEPSLSLHVLYLSLPNNQLSGIIPDLSALTQLTNLDISNNNVTYLETDCNQVKQIPKEECEVLVTLYTNTNGTEWKNNTNWRSINLPCIWYGVVCNNGHVSYLYLSNNQLSGTIPNLSALTQLTNIDLPNNNVTYLETDCNQVKQIPKEECETLITLYNMTNGKEWKNNANWNNMNVPCTWYGIGCYDGHVQYINLSFNGFGQLSGNNLNGTLPDLSAFVQLTFLDLSSNQLSGTLPDLSTLIRLEHLNLSNNQLSGALPDLNALTQLKYLDLSNNQFSGTIPHLTTPSQLEYFNLSNNQLNGIVPSFGELIKLYEFNLSGNNLVYPVANCDQVRQIPKEECKTLVALYNNTNGAKWTNNTNWNIINLPCLWYGVTCNYGYVQEIKLNNNGLEGILTDISVLTQLSRLDLSNNQLSGDVPDLRELTELYKLEIAGNDLYPGTNKTDCNQVKEISKEECEVLVALYNNTNGAKWLNNANWNMTNSPCLWYGIRCNSEHMELNGRVELINLENNGLEGVVPDLSALTQLSYLYLSGNHLVYTTTDCNQVKQIPKEECETLVALYNMTNGKEWKNNANWNNTNVPCTWHGVICHYGHVTDITLSFGNYYPDGNNLNGTLPDLSKLTRLSSLDLANNHLTGPISNLSTLTQLVNLYLSNNQLSGVIPDLSALTQIQMIDLSKNQLTGSLPDLNNLTQLQFLDLSYNNLSGTLPSMSNLTQLQRLILSNNQLSGTVPDLNTLTGLQMLDLSYNQLSGFFPNLRMLFLLQDMRLSDNQFCGDIPLWLSTLNLFNGQLSLSNNHFTLPTDPIFIKFLDEHDVAWKEQVPIEVCKNTDSSIPTDNPDDTDDLPVTTLNLCPSSQIIDVACLNHDHTLSNIVIDKKGNIAGGELSGVVDNHGIVSQVNILPGSTLNGGRMTGYVTNQGTIVDVEFIGSELRGGIVGGTFVNNSRTGGVLRDVQLMGGTHVIGGIVTGFITGDVSNPAVLENVTVRSGAILSGVTFGENVTIQKVAPF